jgi:DNA repair exonuclease SbcCD ATPase subunit
MHSAQGTDNHFFNLIWKEANNIDSFGNNLQEQIQEIHQDILLFSKDVEKLKKQQQAFKTRVTVLRNAIHKGIEKGEDVSSKEENLQEKLMEMAQHAEVNEYTTMMRLLGGAKFLKGHVDTWFKHQSGFGESSDLFQVALPLFGGIY